MRTLLSLVLILSISLMASSCVHEEWTPTLETKTVNQLIDDKPMNFHFKIEAGQVDEFGKGIGKLFVFGPILKRFARFFANLTLSGSEGKEIELDSETIDLSLLKDAETKYLDFIKLDKIILNIKDPSKRDTLKFFNRIEIYLDNAESFDLPVDDKGRFLLLSYDKDLNGLKCGGTCLEMSVAQLNWKTLIFSKTSNNMQLKPKFIINSVPTQTFELAGEVIFSIKFNPGF
ncbi:MAG: hypothetical protein L6Q33_11890 [Bacteriovoracaceae bacterium]|nr:hypothetical protein [Bacteriovoracaceae bacterium]